MPTNQHNRPERRRQLLAPLMAQKRWVIWRLKDGRKIPYQSRHPNRYARSNDPTTWSTYEEAFAVAPRRDGGVGFMLLGSGIGALDLDDCRDPTTGVIDDWAYKLIRRVEDSYVEITPSGCGLRIIGLATGGRVQTLRRVGAGKVEVYRDTARYITITGDEVKCSQT